MARQTYRKTFAHKKLTTQNLGMATETLSPINLAFNGVPRAHAQARQLLLEKPGSRHANKQTCDLEERTYLSLAAKASPKRFDPIEGEAREMLKNGRRPPKNHFNKFGRLTQTIKYDKSCSHCT